MTSISDYSLVETSIAPVPENKNDTMLGKQETRVPKSKMKESRISLNRITPEDHLFTIVAKKKWRTTVNNSDDSYNVPKTKLNKVEQKTVPLIEQSDGDIRFEELMGTNIYQIFNRSIEKIFIKTDDVDLSIQF